MSKFIQMADLTRYKAALASIESLLGIPSETKKTLRYAKPITSSSGAYCVEIKDSATDDDWTVVQSVFTSTELTTQSTSIPSGFTQSTSPLTQEVVSTVTLLIVCDGDSITHGGTASNSFYKWPNQMEIYLRRGLTDTLIVNQGAAGDTYSGMSTNYSANVLPYYTNAPVGARKILIAFGGTNDLAATTVATTKTRCETYCSTAQGDGWEVAVCTLIAHNTNQSEIDEFNTWLRANYASFADYLIDFGALPEFDTTEDAQATDYYSDGIHPNDAGYIKLGIEAARVINTIV